MRNSMLNLQLRNTIWFRRCTLGAPASLPARLFVVATGEQGCRRPQFKLLVATAFSALALTFSIISAQAESLLLTGANVHSISGETLSPGQVLIENGKISAVG